MTEILIITDMGGLQHFQMRVIFAWAIPFNDFMPDGIDKCIEVLNTVLEDFYAVGALADELTHGFHMEERGYIDRTEVNSRLIAFARELERILDKWETHATLIA